MLSVGLITLLCSQLISEDPSRWSNRTAKRRARTDDLLVKLSLPIGYCSDGCQLRDLHIPTLQSPSIDWDQLDPRYDPQKGGKLRANTLRAVRKRLQVEAFAHVTSSLLLQRDDSSTTQCTIVDAASGAGNLAIPLIGALDSMHLTELIDEVWAVEVNERALARLVERSKSGREPPSIPRIVSVCQDLADICIPKNTLVVCSLHACGAATDLAIELAVGQNVPFCVSPCCTAKAIQLRQERYGPSASAQRSAAPITISFPRSEWLRGNLQGVVSEEGNASSVDELYQLLARTADVGLGPQTPTEQREHQRLSKAVIEIDRLEYVRESFEYDTHLVRIQGHKGYGKSELLLGAPRDSSAAKVFANFASFVRLEESFGFAD